MKTSSAVADDTAASVSGTAVGRCFAAIVGLGVVLRLIAWWFEPPLHPDEFFQYLEPAWMRLRGVGIGTWEWTDGVRSWVLPAYHGAWMKLLEWLGVREGATVGRFLQLHWGLASLSLIWSGWWGGRLVAARIAGKCQPQRCPPEADAAPSGWQGGLLGAVLCAAFPLLVTFSVHTLSELPSMLAYVPALVWTADLCGPAPGDDHERRWSASRQAMLAGALLGLSVCVRIANAPLALVPPLVLIAGRQSRLIVALTLGAFVPVVVFGLVDALTWGGFSSSFYRYVKFNLVEDGAAQFGISPTAFYLERLLQRLPIGLPLLALLALAGARVTWPFLLSAVGLIGYLSAQAHKEERFIVLFWPLLLVAAAGTMGGWLGRLRLSSGGRGRVAARVALLGAVAIVLADGSRRFAGYDFQLTRDRLDGQRWVGRRPDVTGLLFDSPLYTGGYLWFGRALPQATFAPELLENPLFSHVLVPRGSSEEDVASSAGFEPVFTAGSFVVLRRK